MKSLFCTLLFLLATGLVQAHSNFVSNPYLPYPPGCAHTADRSAELGPRPGSVKFFEAGIEMLDVQTGEHVPVTLEAYRSPCSEPNRSLLWLALTLADSAVNTAVQLELPIAVVEPMANDRRLMSLVTEPNGWGNGNEADRGRVYLMDEQSGLSGAYASAEIARRWVFLLDNAPLEEGSSGQSMLTASEYNAAFSLVLRYPPYDFLTIEVPSTADLLPSASAILPLSGRQSGAWVIEGVADQGYQVVISEQVRADRTELPLVVFFSHYTFDADSRPLWVVGNAEFEAGAAEVTIPVFTVSGGQFRGSAPAQKTVVGSVTLISRSCDDLGFEYDYAGLGLGTGAHRLQRLFSLETAGYDCRDYEARTAANRQVLQ